jgi:hypothetical protein
VSEPDHYHVRDTRGRCAQCDHQFKLKIADQICLYVRTDQPERLIETIDTLLDEWPKR